MRLKFSFLISSNKLEISTGHMTSGLGYQICFNPMQTVFFFRIGRLDGESK